MGEMERPLVGIKASSFRTLALGFGLGLLSMAFATCGDLFSRTEPAAQDVSEPASSWTCSMHPQIQAQAPGQCPICGMDLVALSKAQASSEQGKVQLSSQARRMAKLQTAPVVSRPGALPQVELLGRMVENGMTLHTISAPREGWIDSVMIDAPGRSVVRGDILARIHVPGVFDANKELIESSKALGFVLPNTAQYRRVQARLKKARANLALLGATPDAIEYIEKEDLEPLRSYPICTPYTGTIIERHLQPGAFVRAGTPVFRLANLSSLWLVLDIHEKDLPLLSLGDHVEVRLEAFPEKTLEGAIVFLDETVHPERRTASARVHIHNPTTRMRAGMFARAVVTPQKSKRSYGKLVIPATAPLFTGRRSVVYREIKQGDELVYEPRTVRLGPRLGDVYPVISGLSLGDRVVTHGAFTLDADLQIRGGASMMAQPGDGQDDPRHQPMPLAPEQQKELQSLFFSYLELQGALADDDHSRLKFNLENFLKVLDRVDLSKASPRAKAMWHKARAILSLQTKNMMAAEDLEQARVAFEQLNFPMILLLARHGNPLPSGIRLAYCPMAFDDAGAYWLQSRDSILNPYFGAKMLRCGEIRQRLDNGDFLMVPADLRVPKDTSSKAAKAHEH